MPKRVTSVCERTQPRKQAARGRFWQMTEELQRAFQGIDPVRLRKDWKKSFERFVRSNKSSAGKRARVLSF